MTITELAAGKGLPARIFQGGWIDNPNKLVATIPQPFGIVSLAIDRTIDKGGYSDLISQRTFLFDRFISDDSDGLLSTSELTTIVDFLQGYLDSGVNLYVHCIAGRSRSSYVLAALLSRVLNISTTDALEIIFTERPGAKENIQESFIEHLKSIGTFSKQESSFLIGLTNPTNPTVITTPDIKTTSVDKAIDKLA